MVHGAAVSAYHKNPLMNGMMELRKATVEKENVKDRKGAFFSEPYVYFALLLAALF